MTNETFDKYIFLQLNSSFTTTSDSFWQTMKEMHVLRLKYGTSGRKISPLPPVVFCSPQNKIYFCKGRAPGHTAFDQKILRRRPHQCIYQTSVQQTYTLFEDGRRLY